MVLGHGRSLHLDRETRFFPNMFSGPASPEPLRIARGSELALLEAPGRRGLSRPDPGDRARDQRDRVGCAAESQIPPGGGRCPDAEPGDPPQEDQEVAGAVLACLAEESS